MDGLPVKRTGRRTPVPGYPNRTYGQTRNLSRAEAQRRRGAKQNPFCLHPRTCLLQGGTVPGSATLPPPFQGRGIFRQIKAPVDERGDITAAMSHKRRGTQRLSWWKRTAPAPFDERGGVAAATSHKRRGTQHLSCRKRAAPACLFPRRPGPPSSTTVPRARDFSPNQGAGR